jgi:carboxyl-terminal processing protease
MPCKTCRTLGLEPVELPNLKGKSGHLSGITIQTKDHGPIEILVVTEGFGPQKFNGRVVVLVNEHTASAGEMVAAFAEENHLATIVGTKTPGRLLSGSAFKAGFGYSVGLPVAAYLTWEGRLIEGKGVTPSIRVELPPEQLVAGEDTQMQRALELVREL